MLTYWLEHLISEGGLHQGPLEVGLAMDLRDSKGASYDLEFSNLEHPPTIHRVLLFINTDSVFFTWLRMICRVVCEGYNLEYTEPKDPHISVDGSIGHRLHETDKEFWSARSFDPQGTFDRNGNRVWFVDRHL
jgi:hypothetical protein